MHVETLNFSFRDADAHPSARNGAWYAAPYTENGARCTCATCTSPYLARLADRAAAKQG